MMYDRVVVPIDGSPRALAVLPRARQLATTWGCPVELLHVAPPDGSPPTDLPEDVPLQVVRSDQVVATLTELVSDETTLVCMSTRGRGLLTDLLFGGVATDLLRRVHTPVVVVGPQVVAPPSAEATVRRLLVPLDGSDAAAAILPVVHDWATSLSLEVVLLHVAYPPGDPVSGSSLSHEALAVIGELERTTADLRERGVRAESLVVEDTVAAAGIMRQASHRMVDLIAMASHGRTGLERMIVGSNTAEVVRRGAVPVLTLRPKRLA